MTPIFLISVLLFALLPVPLAASSLTLAWDSNTESDLAGYRVYYGIRSSDYDFVSDVGNVTQYRVVGLEPETRYYLALTAYDTSGNESDFSAEISAITDDQPVSGSTFLGGAGGGGGGCFIATAAYGSYFNPQVKVLRDFRDEFLTPNSLGRKFVHLYYRYSPRFANHIEKYGFLRFLTRQALLPLIGISSLSLKTAAHKNHSLSPSVSPSSSRLRSALTSATRDQPIIPKAQSHSPAKPSFN